MNSCATAEPRTRWERRPPRKAQFGGHRPIHYGVQEISGVRAIFPTFYRAMLCIRVTSHGPVSVCPCPCPSVTSRSSTKTAKRRITQTTPYDTPGSLVFCCPLKDLREIRPGSSPTRAPNAGGVVKIGDFRQISGYISKTIQDRHIVSIKVE